MESILKSLQTQFLKATLKAYPELESDSFVPELLPSNKELFGHYQYNSAMKLSSKLGQKPREIAAKILEQLFPIPLIEKTEIAGPGFINIFLSQEALSQHLQKVATDAHLGIDLPEKPERIIVEFSSPNIAKELHVGHLRSTIIGDCLARLFEFLGHDVVRLNHIGDWGTSFGMLIAYLKEEAPGVLSGETGTDLSQLVAWYKASKHRFDTDYPFKKRAQLEVVALQGGDPVARRAWEIICEISRQAYQEIYDMLEVRLHERGESFYNPVLPEVVADMEKKGLVTLSDGAKCVFLPGFMNRDGDPFPLMIQKSDGGYTYDTTDLAALKHRAQVEKADRIIVVTDAGQSTHFAMVFEAARLAGYYDPSKLRIDHVPFGLVLGPDGKKFRTRAGETERLIDLLNTAIVKAQEILEEKSPELSPQEREELAHTLGIGAVKYADLSCNRLSDYTFSYDRMLRFEGNTAAFLLYAYVRIEGIARKVKADLTEVRKHAQINLKHPSECALGLHLLRFPEALDQVASELLPNRLTDYLYTLAEKFNGFYRDCPVEGSAEKESRLLLCDITARTLKQGLQLLGLKTAQRM